MTTTVELLNKYLPANDRHSPGQRLTAVSGKGFEDWYANKRLTDLYRDEARAHALETAVKCIRAYDPSKDKGVTDGTVPLDVAFGRFVYVRVQQRLHDWYRKHIDDPRTNAPRAATSDVPLLHNDLDGHDDFTDQAVAAADIDRWRYAASRVGLSVEEWLVSVANRAASHD